MRRLVLLVFAAMSVGVAAPAHAEVTDRNPAGFTSKTTVQMAGTTDRVFSAFVQEIGQWWDSAHTFSGDAANLWLTPTPGGCLCETLANRGGVQHAQVIHVVPGELLRMTGALGPLQSEAVVGTLTWAFSANPQGGVTATATYVVSGYYPGGIDKIAGAVDTVIGDQLRRLKAHVERSRR
jgi:uncharacterized protein YndB with AHSA1/START domain